MDDVRTAELADEQWPVAQLRDEGAHVLDLQQAIEAASVEAD